MRSSFRLGDLVAARLNNFDFLRFALASSVIYSHGLLLAGLPSYDPLTALSGGRLFAGAVAVDFFFLISGFLITASWHQNHGLLRFMQNRVLRIFPAFVVVGLFCGLVVAPLGAASAADYFKALNPPRFLAGILTLAQLNLPPTFAFNPNPTQVNGSIWTIRIEFECYLLVAFCGLLGLFKRRWLPLALLILTALACTFLDALPPALQRFDSHVRFLTFFLSGMSAYLYRERIPLRGAYSLGAFVLALIGCMTRAETVFLALFGGYCIFYLAFTSRLPLQRFAARGDFSYGMYLWAWPIEQILVRFLLPAVNAYVVVALTFVLTIAVAVLTWHLVESRALRLKRARIGVPLFARWGSRRSLQGGAAA